MRWLLLLLLLGLWPAAGLAEDQAVSAPAECQVYADFCCNQITYACLVLKPGPDCFCLPHRCLSPLIPCAFEVCLPAACHRPVVPCEPCPVEICLPEACHLPAVVPMLEPPCAGEPEGETERAAPPDAEPAE